MAAIALVDTRGPRTRDRYAGTDPTAGSTSGDGDTDPTNLVRLLADRLVAGLDHRPFRPTDDQLAWVWGGQLGPGETPHSRAKIAGCRYAELFASHVVQDVTVQGAVGAYTRIWLCARRSFIKSMESGEPDQPGDAELSRWENDGGAWRPGNEIDDLPPSTPT
jgi:hypothetical protein